MDRLTKDSIEDFIERFNRFDGAVIRSIQYKTSSRSSEGEFEIIIKVTDKYFSDGNPFSGDALLKILFKGSIEFRVWEPGGGVNVVINDEVVSYCTDEKIYINFDPLHSKNWQTKSWSINEIRNSSFYVGGSELLWMIMI